MFDDSFDADDRSLESSRASGYVRELLHLAWLHTVRRTNKLNAFSQTYCIKKYRFKEVNFSRLRDRKRAKNCIVRRVQSLAQDSTRAPTSSIPPTMCSEIASLSLLLLRLALLTFVLMVALVLVISALCLIPLRHLARFPRRPVSSSAT